MESKKCNKCGEVKELQFFGKKTKEKLSTICRVCTNKRLNDRRIERCKDPEYKKKLNQQSYERQKVRILVDDDYRIKLNKKRTDRIKRKKPIDDNHKIKLNKEVSDRKKMNKDDYRKKVNKRISDKRKRKKLIDDDYRKKMNRKGSDRRKRKYHSDPIYRLRIVTSKNLREIFKRRLGVTKQLQTNKILGIDYEGFFKYIESQFEEGMSWENRDQWHIDHIVPVSVGNTYEEIVYLNHYTNLKPLWVFDNLSKGDKINESNIDMYNKFLKDMRGHIIKSPNM